MNVKNGLWLLVGLMLVLTACYRDFDALSHARLADWNPDLVIPIIDDELAVEDISGGRIAENELDTNDRGYLVFHFYGLVKTPSAGEQIVLADQALPNLNIPARNPLPTPGTVITASQNAPVDFGGGRRLTSIVAKAGNFNLNILNQMGVPVEARITLPDVTNSTGAPLVVTTTLPAGQRNLEAINLGGYTLRLDAGTGYNNLRSEVRITTLSGNTTSPGSGLTVSAELKQLSFSYISGWVGNFSYEVNRLDKVNIKIFDNVLDDGFNELNFSDPSLRLQVMNTGGVAAAISMSNIISYQTEDQPRALTGPGVDSLKPSSPLVINAASLANNRVTPGFKNFALDQTNTDLDDIFKFYLNVPRTVQYSAGAQSVPGSTVNLNQWLFDTSRVRLYTEVQLPLDGFSRRLALQDTFDLDLPGNENDVTVQEASVKSVLTNGFPIDGELQVYFAKEDANSFVYIDSLFNCPTPNVNTPSCRYFSSAALASSGRVASPTVTQSRVTINQARYARLKTQANRIMVRCIMRTTDNGNRRIQIYPESRLRLQLGVAVKTKADLN